MSQDEEYASPTGTVEGDMQVAASAFHEATKPDAPQIRKPSAGQVTLLYGLRVGDEVYKEAEVRELNGGDEEALAKLDARKAGNLYFINVEDLVLRRAVTRIGPVNVQDKPEVLGELLIGDRGLLFTEVLIATFGETKEYEEVTCPSCEALNDIMINLRAMLEVKGRVAPGEEPTVDVTLSTGQLVNFRYPNGLDQMQVYQTKRDASEPELNTFMLARCLQTKVGKAPQDFIRNLSLPDRRNIVKTLSAAPSVAFKEVSVPCTSCNEMIPFAFGWADLLFG